MRLTDSSIPRQEPLPHPFCPLPHHSGRAGLPGAKESALHPTEHSQKSQPSAPASWGPSYPARQRSARGASLYHIQEGVGREREIINASIETTLHFWGHNSIQKNWENFSRHRENIGSVQQPPQTNHSIGIWETVVCPNHM